MATALVLSAGAVAALPSQAHERWQHGYGMGYGMGPGHGYHHQYHRGMMGPGMMGPGMMGYGCPGMMMGRGGMGYGYGMGPGMMGPGMGYGPGPGMGYGMMQPRRDGDGDDDTGAMGPGMMGPGMGQGMGPGMGQGMMGRGYGMHRGQARDVSADDMRAMLERHLAWQDNPNLKVGTVEEKDDGTIVGEIVTKDDSLVDRLEFDPRTGRMRRAN
jgi:hypothetical protein